MSPRDIVESMWSLSTHSLSTSCGCNSRSLVSDITARTFPRVYRCRWSWGDELMVVCIKLGHSGLNSLREGIFSNDWQRSL